MGNSRYKDSHLGIYLEVDQAYYFAGEQVRGNIYLNVLQDRPYKQLKLTLIGQEHVYWVSEKCEYSINSVTPDKQEHIDKREQYRNSLEVVRTLDPNITHKNHFKVSYTNDYKNYESSFEVCEFVQKVERGQYTFPFIFALSSMMAGSFRKGKNNYIAYFLIAEMVSAETPERNQNYVAPLNLIEPARILDAPKTIKKSINLEDSCFSSIRPGIKNIEVIVNSVCVTDGAALQIRYRYEENRPLHFRIYLAQRRVLISHEKQAKYIEDETNLLGEFETHPQAPMLVRIPQNLRYCTAIGSVTALYYVLLMEISAGCCSNASLSSMQCHVYVKAKEPQIIQQEKVPAPKDWKPIMHAPVQFVNMKPFKQRVTKKMPYFNISQEVFNPSQMFTSGLLPSFSRKKQSKQPQAPLSRAQKLNKPEMHEDFQANNAQTDRPMLEKKQQVKINKQKASKSKQGPLMETKQSTSPINRQQKLLPKTKQAIKNESKDLTKYKMNKAQSTDDNLTLDGIVRSRRRRRLS